MIVEARDWLPASALIDQVVREECAHVVREWSERWSIQPGFVLRDLAPYTRPRATTQPEHRIGKSVEIGWSANKALQLALWSVGQKPADTKLSEADASVLEALGEEIALDLSGVLARQLGIQTPTQLSSIPQSGGEVALDLETQVRDVSLRAFFGPQTLTRYRKSRCANPPARKRPGLTFPAATLASTAIDVDAILGKAELTLRDFRSVEVGDVITLDTAIDAPIQLSARSSNKPLMGGIFRLADSRALLTLCEPEAVFPT